MPPPWALTRGRSIGRKGYPSGHVGENAYLAATEMGLGRQRDRGFMDDAMNEMLGAEESVVFMHALGHSAAA